MDLTIYSPCHCDNYHFVSVQKFKQKGREEQCEPDGPSQAKKVATLLGTDHEMMMKAFCKPKIKVGDKNLMI